MSKFTYKRISLKITRKLKGWARDLQYYSGFNHSFYNNTHGSRILVYHGICQEDPTRFNPIFLTVSIFEAQLKLYKKHCHIISLDDYYAGNFAADKFNICLTFDDGFANNYKYVLPLLKKYKIPATFFITGVANDGYDILWNDFLGIVSKYGPQTMVYKNEKFYKGGYNHYYSADTHIALKEKLRSLGFDEKLDAMQQLYPLAPFKENEQEKDYWLQITPPQIKELAASPYAQIGAHGYYHNDLAQINPADAFAELVNVKQCLETLTEKPVTSLAFPYGSYNAEVIALAKKAGYEQLLATDFNSPMDGLEKTLRERFTVNPFISPVNQLYANIIRRYD